MPQTSREADRATDIENIAANRTLTQSELDEYTDLALISWRRVLAQLKRDRDLRAEAVDAGA